VLPISAIFWPFATFSPSFTRMSRLCAYADRIRLVVLDDDELAVAAQARARVHDGSRRARDHRLPALPAMSMPFRFAVSENVPTILPFAGHTHSICRRRRRRR
jgi:hypothetical protein